MKWFTMLVFLEGKSYYKGVIGKITESLSEPGKSFVDS